VICAQAGAEDDGFLVLKGEFFGIGSQWMEGNVVALFLECLGDRLHSVPLHHQEGGVAGGQVVEIIGG